MGRTRVSGPGKRRSSSQLPQRMAWNWLLEPVLSGSPRLSTA